MFSNIDILEVIIRVLAILLMAFVLPWITKKVGAENYAKLLQAIKLAVNAAEQVFSDPGSGAKKKQWVLDFINSKFKIKEDDVERLLEAFVYEINKDKLEPLIYEATLDNTVE
ncbi:hypothetical protein JR334_02080 [Clostridia bacterium]|nr:hypothetical protein JR334_02080 [Clostridia bacterium]